MQIENAGAWGASLMDEDDEDETDEKQAPAGPGTNALWSQFQVYYVSTSMHTCFIAQFQLSSMYMCVKIYICMYRFIYVCM